MKKVPNWILIIFIIVLAIASKFIFFPKENKASASSSAKVAPVVNYTVVKARPYSQRFFTAGKTGAFNEVQILPELSAKVMAIYFKEGQSVEKGELLVKLNDADISAQLQKVQSQLELAKQKLQRLKKLREIDGVSEEEYEMQENEISTLSAERQYIQAQLNKTDIRAPFSGVLGLKQVSEGAFVNPGNVLVTLVQQKPIYIEFSLPGRYAQALTRGKTIQFEPEEEESSGFLTARLYALEPRLDDATKSIRARAEYDGARKLLPGTYVKVYVQLGDSGSRLMVPSYCVIPVLKGNKVYRYQAGRAIETPVKLGARSDQDILVLEGLAEGDTILTTGLMSLKKDMPVTLLKPANTK